MPCRWLHARFSQAGISLAACCLCQSNHSYKIAFGQGGVFSFITNYNYSPKKKKKINSCTVSLRFLFQFTIPKFYQLPTPNSKSSQTFATNSFVIPLRRIHTPKGRSLPSRPVLGPILYRQASGVCLLFTAPSSLQPASKKTRFLEKVEFLRFLGGF